jgi:ppGpp synthetase/RelA/SpoT-type nucleotidyltranferase
MAWTLPEYSRGQVNKAGDALISASGPSDDDLLIINNWRAAHSCPLLTIKTTLAARAKRRNPGVLISQRTKRIKAIELKLRENRAHGLTMNLSQMQDIGGCRAVFATVAEAEALLNYYHEQWKKNPNRGGTLKRITNYIDQPKATGYRGVHIICKYESEVDHHKVYNGLQIEIQLRSKLQHYWAMAVETVDFFTGQALKSNIGEFDWKRFFVLVSNEFARIEKRNLVPGAPTDKDAAKTELKNYSKQITALEGFQTAQKIPQAANFKSKPGQLYLLKLDLDRRMISHTVFSREKIKEAQERYLADEGQNKGNPAIQSLLVSVDSLNALPKAYPSYFLDITNFVHVLKKIIN